MRCCTRTSPPNQRLGALVALALSSMFGVAILRNNSYSSPEFPELIGDWLDGVWTSHGSCSFAGGGRGEVTHAQASHIYDQMGGCTLC